MSAAAVKPEAGRSGGLPEGVFLTPCGTRWMVSRQTRHAAQGIVLSVAELEQLRDLIDAQIGAKP